MGPSAPSSSLCFGFTSADSPCSSVARSTPRSNSPPPNMATRRQNLGVSKIHSSPQDRLNVFQRNVPPPDTRKKVRHRKPHPFVHSVSQRICHVFMQQCFQSSSQEYLRVSRNFAISLVL